MLELISMFGALFILSDILDSSKKNREVEFKNNILNLDINKEYTSNDIKSIFSNNFDLIVSIDDLSEDSIKKIHRMLNQVYGNLCGETKYYSKSIILAFFVKQKTYKNDKDKLKSLLSLILEELNEEKKLFGLNKRKREIFNELLKSSKFDESDRKGILELKDIITIRYQELIRKEESSKELSKKSMKVACLGILIALIPYFPDFIKLFK